MTTTKARLAELDAMSADLVLAGDQDDVVRVLLTLIAWLRVDREEDRADTLTIAVCDRIMKQITAQAPTSQTSQT